MLAIVTCIAFSGTAVAQQVLTPERAIPNQYIVVLDDAQTARTQVAAEAQALARQHGGRVTNGYTAVADGNGTNDCNGHGTHVGATVGGAIYRVAKSVELHSVRVLGCNGSGSTSGVIAGVDWVRANHSTPAVANMSLGGGASTALDDAVRAAIASGVTFAIAAGNSNANACNSSPARVEQALTVGSTTNTDARSSFSNFGTCVDLFAPGSSITSAWSTSDTATNTISGTSMATPHVAGVAALYLAMNPSASPNAVQAAVVNNATTNKVTGAGSGSPNRSTRCSARHRRPIFRRRLPSRTPVPA
jgi:subtilisin family serine protease